MSNKAESTINERLKILMEVLGTNPAKLSRILDTSDSTVRNYIYRDTKPGYDVIEKLYRSFRHINLYWLFGEQGEPLLASPPAGATGSVTASKKITRSLVVGNAANATQNQAGDSDKDVLIEQLRSQLADKERTIQILLGQKP
jgi:hypothetical protein